MLVWNRADRILAAQQREVEHGFRPMARERGWYRGQHGPLPTCECKGLKHDDGCAIKADSDAMWRRAEGVAE